MLVRVRFDQATEACAAEVTTKMRPEDRRQIEALGDEVDGAVATAIKLSVGEAWLVYFNDELVALWGVMPQSWLTGHAVPWLVATQAVEKYPKTFYVESKKMVRSLRANYRYLKNMVDARFTRSVKWAERIGFVTSAPMPIGRLGSEFVMIHMARGGQS